jgi:DNA-binding GntR family transcriptional regulator
MRASDRAYTALREALARLVADGLAEPAPGRGLVVTAVSLEEARPLFDLRIALETLAARRAAERIAAEPETAADGDLGTDDPAHDDLGPDDLGHRGRLLALARRFEDVREHLAGGADPTDYYALTGELDAALDAACGNAYLAETLRGLRLHLGRVRRLARNSPARLADSAREHSDIARSVASGDPELAAAGTVVHLRHALAHLLGAAASAAQSSPTAPSSSTASTPPTPPTTPTSPTSTRQESTP